MVSLVVAILWLVCTSCSLTVDIAILTLKPLTDHVTPIMAFHDRGHSFPVLQGMTFYTQRKINRNNIKRDIGCHILNGLNFNKKWRETLKASHSTIFWKIHWKKWNDSLRDVFIQQMHSHKHSHSSCTQREIYDHVLEEKNSAKGLNFNKKWRNTTKDTHRMIFWRRRRKSTRCQLQTHLHLMAAFA